MVCPMSFKTNDCQQLSLDDSFMTLTERERKALEKSWAKIFADEIFPAIDEERFSVLYSDKASRPNAPVNVIIGALIIKELFDYSDDEIVENLILDLHFQYALHTTSFAEQPISDKTLSRFLSRMELICTCISRLVVYITKNHPEKIPAQLERYADPNDYNHLFYHQRNDDMDQIIQIPFRPNSC